VMATLAGLGLLTRVSTALGLYVATGLLILVFAWPATGPLGSRLRRFARGLASRRTLAGLAILLGFVTLSGIVNYQRWGEPLAFTGDPRSHIVFIRHPYLLARLEAYGNFNIQRLWYGILYYFFPIWTIVRPDGEFLFSRFETRVFDGVELPPSSFLLSDPLLLVLGGAYLLRLPRLASERLLDLGAVAALMIGFAIPVFLVQIFMTMAFRYRMEFYPLLEFSAFMGFYALCVNPRQFSPSSRNGLSAILIASAGIGIIYCHLLLFLYKISEGGDYAHPGTGTGVSAANGWIDYYHTRLKFVFPSIAQRLHLY
jgi:hypothetical protein